MVALLKILWLCGQTILTTRETSSKIKLRQNRRVVDNPPDTQPFTVGPVNESAFRTCVITMQHLEPLWTVLLTFSMKQIRWPEVMLAVCTSHPQTQTRTQGDGPCTTWGRGKRTFKHAVWKINNLISFRESTHVWREVQRAQGPHWDQLLQKEKKVRGVWMI